MKLTWPRFLAAFFILALVTSYTATVAYAEDGTPDSQVSRHIRAPQDLFADASATITAPAPIPECELTHSCAPVTPAVVTVQAPDTIDITKSVTAIAMLLLTIISTILSWPLGKLLGSQTKAKETLNDLNMGPYASYAVTLAIKWGLHVAGIEASDLAHVEVRSTFMRNVISFLNGQFPEVVAWIQTSGSLDQFITAHLPAGTPPPSA